ncbi:Trp operon repressor [Vibrio angustum S14]|uniref:Trp operon repressor homolog n=2 Tax=Photobacterium angustum TaxID=661 RepID=Q1ZJY7_PHOAS|nr:Trp operon repressor [Vibrio angustum S14] [Photobacterium angustum S14]
MADILVSIDYQGTLQQDNIPDEVTMTTTSDSPDFTEWQNVLDLIRHASAEERDALLFQVLLTHDEREALIARVNIVHELLNGERSQRKISELLGVGVATITRGSNELKHQDDETKAWLANFLVQNKPEQ